MDLVILLFLRNLTIEAVGLPERNEFFYLLALGYLVKLNLHLLVLVQFCILHQLLLLCLILVSAYYLRSYHWSQAIQLVLLLVKISCEGIQGIWTVVLHELLNPRPIIRCCLVLVLIINFRITMPIQLLLLNLAMLRNATTPLLYQIPQVTYFLLNFLVHRHDVIAVAVYSGVLL